MRLFTSIISTLAVFAFASTASADLVISASADRDTLALTPGDQFTIDITLETTGPEATGLGLRAANWNPGDLTFVSAVIPNANPLAPNGQLFAAELAPGFFAGGIGSTITPSEDGVGPGESVNLFQGVAAAPASAASDMLTVTFQYNGGAGTIDIGVFAEYLDGYVSTGGNAVTNTSISYVPEPGTALLMGLGLAGLAVAGRRE